MVALAPGLCRPDGTPTQDLAIYTRQRDGAVTGPGLQAADAGSPQLGTDQHDRVLAAWSTPAGIRTSVHVAGGGWSAPATVPAPAPGFVSAVGPEGHAVLSWVEGGTLRVSSGRLGATGFGPPETLAETPSIGLAAAVAADGSAAVAFPTGRFGHVVRVAERVGTNPFCAAEEVAAMEAEPLLPYRLGVWLDGHRATVLWDKRLIRGDGPPCASAAGPLAAELAVARRVRRGRVLRRGLRVRLRADRAATVRVALRARGRVLAARRVAVSPTATIRTLSLARAGRRMLRRHAVTRAQVVVRSAGAVVALQRLTLARRG